MNNTSFTALGAALVVLAIGTAAIADTVVQYENGTTYETDSLPEFTPSGDDMAGSFIIATYEDATVETLTWPVNDTVSGAGWSLTVDTDSYNANWLLENTGAQGLKSLFIDFGSGGAAIDTANGGTSGSGVYGRAYTPVSGDAPLDVVATHRHRIALTGQPPVGDLYRVLQIDFTNSGGLPASSELVFRLDTDKMSDTLSAIPEPSAACMLAILAALTATSRRSPTPASRPKISN